MKNKRERSTKLNVLKNMPPLFHVLQDKDYDVRNSEVVQWMISQPKIMQWLFDYLKETGFIKFDGVSEKWKGIDR